MLLLSGNLIINDQKEIYLLYRKDHHFYETPGGKIKPEESVDFENPTQPELEAVARRELLEEVSGIIQIVSLKYFTAVQFQAPDGRKAIAHKFITTVKGRLYPKEDNFDTEKSRWIKINELDKYSLSPDLKILLPKIKNYFQF